MRERRLISQYSRKSGATLCRSSTPIFFGTLVQLSALPYNWFHISRHKGDNADTVDNCASRARSPPKRKKPMAGNPLVSSGN